jgi:hypothetical protein
MELSFSCNHHEPPSKCKLGLFGGKPYPRNCAACIAAGENNPAYATALFTRALNSHPLDKPAISGCCDPPAK